MKFSLAAIVLATAVVAEVNHPAFRVGHAAAEKRDVEERQLDSLFSKATGAVASVFSVATDGAASVATDAIPSVFDQATSGAANAGDKVTSVGGNAVSAVTGGVVSVFSDATSAAGQGSDATSTHFKVGAVAVAGVAAGVIALVF